MNKIDYLLSLKDKPQEIYNTWQSLGGMTAKNSTKMYIKDTLFKIEEDCSMKGAYIYCLYEYSVNVSKGFGQIDWNDLDADSVNGLCYFYQGVESPNFRLILTPDQAKKIDEKIDVPSDFTPFSEDENTDVKTSSAVSISDDEYKIIMAELGVPFLSFDELEYNKDTITQICIKPALDTYYSYFPMVIDEAVGNKSSGTQWKVAYHNFDTNLSAVAYKADAFMTVGATGGSGSSFSNAFTFMRTEMMGAGSFGAGYRWGNGLRYQKPVPGFVGLESTDAMLMAMAVRQGYLNYFRREYSRDVIENGIKYVQGYTTIGGCLNIHWLCADMDYSHIPYWDLSDVRKLCTAYALRNIGAIRTMVKTNDNIPFNADNMASRADSLEQAVLDKWKESSLPASLALSRGGL